MEVIVFSGFLGAGKTSLLMPFARHLVASEEAQGAEGETKLVIIENEVGEAGIDDKVLKKEGLLVEELFTGCICCTLTSDLAILINELEDKYHPRWVIIEATGIAYPQNIVSTLKRYGQGIDRIRVVGIADAERWDELYTVMGGLIEGQLSEAEVVLINKIDLVARDHLKKVRDDIISLNKEAIIEEVTAMQEVNPKLWDQIMSL